MARIKESILIQADLQKTYRAAEKYPLFVEGFSKKEILRMDTRNLKIRAQNKFFTIPLTWEGKGIKHQNERIKWIQTHGLLRGLTAKWTFLQHNQNVTEVIINGRFNGLSLQGKIIEILAPFLIANTTKKILMSLKKIVEQEKR